MFVFTKRQVVDLNSSRKQTNYIMGFTQGGCLHFKNFNEKYEFLSFDTFF